jgi:hypothetical protein
MFGYVDGSIRPPPQSIVSTGNGFESFTLNPALLHWHMEYQLILDINYKKKMYSNNNINL